MVDCSEIAADVPGCSVEAQQKLALSEKVILFRWGHDMGAVLRKRFCPDECRMNPRFRPGKCSSPCSCTGEVSGAEIKSQLWTVCDTNPRHKTRNKKSCVH